VVNGDLDSDYRLKALKRVSIAAGAVLFMLFGGAAGYYAIGGGRYGFLDCIYMTINAVATVGFREVIPVDTVLLKVYTIMLVLMGAGTMLYMLSMVTATILEGDIGDLFRRRRMNKDIDRLNDHYIVCGAGRNGEHAVLELHRSGLPVLVVESHEDRIVEFKDRHGVEPMHIIGDATEEVVLRRAGIDRARGLVATLPEDRDNMFLVLTARQLNQKLRIVCKINEDSSRRKLLQVGADVAISPSEMGGRRMFNEMVRPGVVSFIERLFHNRQELVIDEVLVCGGSGLAGKKLSETDIRREYNLLVVGIQEGEGGFFAYNPSPDFVLRDGMTLMVLGPKDSIDRLRNTCIA
jgi:voltage-gated potassium channel